mgnify:CR=1 FL=1
MIKIQEEALDMLSNLVPLPSETEMPAVPDTNGSIELLQACLGQFAERLRRLGQSESAHFLDVAALVLQDGDNKLARYPVRRRSNAGG